MKKLILLVMVMLNGSLSFAQVSGDDADLKNPVYPNAAVEHQEQMVYLKIGPSIGKVLNHSQDVTMNSAGFIKYSDSFIYGLEYTSYLAKQDNVKTKVTQVVAGYRHLWDKKIIPYGLIQFGPSKFKSDLTNATGISTTLDLGLDIIKIYKVKGSVGVRKSFITSPNDDLGSVSFTDMYATIGFVW